MSAATVGVNSISYFPGSHLFGFMDDLAYSPASNPAFEESMSFIEEAQDRPWPLDLDSVKARTFNKLVIDLSTDSIPVDVLRNISEVVLVNEPQTLEAPDCNP